MTRTLPKAILLMGPTASGKTSLAMKLSENFPIALISVDSAQVFRDMNIGTSKPDRNTLAKYPHHLIDLISPEESYSAARFCQDALALITTITAQGKIPLLVGGTMLYFKALTEGLSELPQATAALRTALDAQAKEEGWPAMHAKLANIDPVTAARLKPTDAQRIQRALEVFHSSGRSLSEWLVISPSQKPAVNFLSLGLLPSDRTILHAHIAVRFDQMLSEGLINEVESLRQTYRLSENLPSMRCVGYRQVWDVLEGRAPQSEMRDRGIFATRQLAKRQITWLLNTLKPNTYDPLSSGILDHLKAEINQFIV